ncbi:BTAD domain-containing putative transcriptional regulator [Nonomuraea sp. CA-143628]|uniref:BTAD domain-containing putative transcriptional regulator n=1 Tax=Nonomuraea sp. CA-143628 TaxID=3239997 RepID=UPI003D8BAD22
MRFGILGPLEVWAADGSRVELREPKIRSLLVALLVREGRSVPNDRLIEDVWGDELPSNPTAALYTKISRLRRLLDRAEPGSGRLVESLGQGYALRAGPDAVDMVRFTALLARATEAKETADRAALFADALALWRGSAFDEVRDAEYVQLPRQRLEELRLVALEAQAEARLEAGEAAGDTGLLASELSDLVALHPLRERLHAVYLRALARAGRQQEALMAYHDLRRRLADELGVDPAPELTAAYYEILRPDPVAAVRGQRPEIPATLTGLIGRDGALAEVASRLRTARLVTLTGPGGVGKSRLALELMRRVADEFQDGVWLVELAACTEEPAEAMLVALGIRDDACSVPARAAQRLADALRGRHALLVLDSCEHLIGPVTEVAESLLKAAPELRILATSRRSIGLAGEVLWQVPPLDQDSAMELFVERAAAAVPSFAVDDGTREAVAEICRRLDGLPLALELAATRLRVLDVGELARRLDDRFQLLSTGHRCAPPQQRTLRMMIDWSWELLTVVERTVLRRLAVHADGCVLRAAEEVCAGDGVDSADVLEALAGLVDASLVIPGTRCRMLESVAAYSLERLAEAGERHSVRQRHLRYYTVFAEQAEPHLRDHRQRRRLERLDAETANLRAALEHAIDTSSAEYALRLVNAQAWYWLLRGRYAEARMSLDKALSIADEGPAGLRTRALIWHAAFAFLTGVGDNAPFVPEESIDDPASRALAAWLRGLVQYAPGRDLAESEAWTKQALAAFRSLHDRWGVAAALAIRAGHAVLRGNLKAADEFGRESQELFREFGDRWGQLQTIHPLAALAEIKGDYRRAAELQGDGLRLAEELALWPSVADRLIGLGRIALLTGDHPRARELHERAHRCAVAHGYVSGELHAELGLALVARRTGDFTLAEGLLRGLSERYMKVDPTFRSALILAELGFTVEQRGDAAAALTLHRDGLAVAHETGDARAVALAMEGMAGAYAAGGEHTNAATLLGAAAAARESLGAPLPPAERRDVDRITTKVRAALGEDGFAAAFRRGSTVDPSEL